MFTPRDRDLERGWPGRIEGDRVIHLAAQTLQSFFTGGGKAREHAEYALAEVELRPPVLHPPSIRIFDGGDFIFANPASIYGPEDEIPFPDGAGHVEAALRLAAIVGADETIGGFTIANDWVAAGLAGAKARDFALSLGPVLVTPDELRPPGHWETMLDHARRNTRLLAGDVIAGKATRQGCPLHPGDVVELEFEGIGALRNRIGPPT
jgi:2-keto-4-pentenoate hydratase/2-oxohepta-3-ene-1,7-dioic acid hydratase in catechol pathway